MLFLTLVMMYKFLNIYLLAFVLHVPDILVDFVFKLCDCGFYCS